MRNNPHEHECHSTRRSGKVKGATKYWVREKVKDWVLENQKVTTKELVRSVWMTKTMELCLVCGLATIWVTKTMELSCILLPMLFGVNLRLSTDCDVLSFPFILESQLLIHDFIHFIYPSIHEVIQAKATDLHPTHTPTPTHTATGFTSILHTRQAGCKQ